MAFIAIVITIIHIAITSIIADVNVNISYVNPYPDKGFASYEIAFSMQNRCSFFPRCLLFGCCDEFIHHAKSVYFEAQERHPDERLYACMLHRGIACSYDKSMQDRHIYDLWMFKETITDTMVINSIITLPPTMPDVYAALDKRSSETFKLIIMTMCDVKELVSKFLVNSQYDNVFLSYKTKQQGLSYIFIELYK